MKKVAKWGCASIVALAVVGILISTRSGGPVEEIARAPIEPAAAPAQTSPPPIIPSDTAAATDSPAPTDTLIPTDTPVPTDTPLSPTETPPPTPTPEPITLSGAGQAATDEIQLPAAVSVANFTHDGTHNFIVTALTDDQEDILINAIGAYAGERPLVGSSAVFDITADGSWTIQIRAIGRQDTPAFQGEGDAVSDLFDPPGRSAWEFSHDGARNFIVYAHCAGGSQIIQNEIGALSGSSIIAFDDGPCFWEVQADGTWSLKPRK